MQAIEISNAVKTKCPDIRLGCIECDVDVHLENKALWEAIEATIVNLQQIMTRDHISSLPVINASRKAYKALGKDPARYRLSAEALLRRVLGGKSLYRVNNVVDLLNLVSIQTGFSIGGYDKGQISGKAVLGIGRKGEPYKGIGRGDLNISNLPVLRDDLGAFGSPTSDSSRTLVGNLTNNFLMVFFDFAHDEALFPAMELADNLLSQFANAKNLTKSHL